MNAVTAPYTLLRRAGGIGQSPAPPPPVERRAGLLREDVSDHAYKVVMRRIVRAQTLYAIGAALCVWNTYASIAFIVLVQINYAFGSRIPLLARIST